MYNTLKMYSGSCLASARSLLAAIAAAAFVIAFEIRVAAQVNMQLMSSSRISSESLNFAPYAPLPEETSPRSQLMERVRRDWSLIWS